MDVMGFSEGNELLDPILGHHGSEGLKDAGMTWLELLRGPSWVRKLQSKDVWEGKEAWRDWKFHRIHISRMTNGRIEDRN